ncbi:hypothetical protein WJ978_15970 [Achromobacter xylosoxidans]
MNPQLHQFIVDYGLWAVFGGTLLEGEAWWCWRVSCRTSGCCTCPT